MTRDGDIISCLMAWEVDILVIKRSRVIVGCTFWNNVDDLINFFIYCENTKQFWTSSYKWWNNISEFNIGRNDIFEECTLFGYPGEEDIIHILNYCVLLAKYFIYTNKLNGNNTLDLYSDFVLLKRKIYIEKTNCFPNKINHYCFEKWLFLYEGLQIIKGTIIREIFIYYYFVSNVLHFFLIRHLIV